MWHAIEAVAGSQVIPYIFKKGYISKRLTQCLTNEFLLTWVMCVCVCVCEEERKIRHEFSVFVYCTYFLWELSYSGCATKMYVVFCSCAVKSLPSWNCSDLAENNTPIEETCLLRSLNVIQWNVKVWTPKCEIFPLFDNENTKFWEGISEFTSLFFYGAADALSLVFEKERRRNRRERKKNYCWQHVSLVTLNLWRFPILSDHSVFGAC